MFFVGFPLLLVPLAILNIVVFLMPGVEFSAPVFNLPLMGGRFFTGTFGDAIIALSALFLVIEIVKSARARTKYAVDHFLSLLLFVGAVAEFIWLPRFATPTMFVLLALMFVDVAGGFAMGFSARKPRAQAVPRSEPHRSAPADEPDRVSDRLESDPSDLAPKLRDTSR